MEFTLKDLLYIGSIVAAYFSGRVGLISKINKVDKELNDKVSKINTDLEVQKTKNEHQQQVIDQFQKNMNDHLPSLYEIIKNYSKK